VKKFRFTLQALFTVYQQREQAALEVYARALTERQKASEKLAEAERRCLEAWDFNRLRMASGLSAAELWRSQQYCVLAKKAQERQMEAWRHTQRVVDRVLEGLLATRQAREAVEKYRTRQQERHYRDTQREEQKIIDDLSRQTEVLTGISSGKLIEMEVTR
jgi:flagellar export protein FliJ